MAGPSFEAAFDSGVNHSTPVPWRNCWEYCKGVTGLTGTRQLEAPHSPVCVDCALRWLSPPAAAQGHSLETVKWWRDGTCAGDWTPLAFVWTQDKPLSSLLITPATYPSGVACLSGALPASGAWGPVSDFTWEAPELDGKANVRAQCKPRAGGGPLERGMGIGLSWRGLVTSDSLQGGVRVWWGLYVVGHVFP